MIRMMTLAAVAALAAGAAQAQPVRVSLVGKSTDQIQADLASAARRVCLNETQSETLRLAAFSRCYKATLKTATASLEGVQVAQADQRLIARR